MTVNHESTMRCDEFADRLADFLERETAEEAREAMESHALACAECGALLADLRDIALQAANLPELTPSRDLWGEIAARIDAPVIPLNTGEWKGTPVSVPAVRRRTFLRASALAASLVAAAALGAFGTYQYLSRAAADAPPTVAASPDASAAAARSESRVASSGDATAPATATGNPDSQAAATPVANTNNAEQAVPAVVLPLSPAEATYATEIGRLEAVIRQRRAQLDPVTLAVIEKNLRVIDEAIAQCKDALARDSASAFLMESLNHALENKVRLLRTTAMLPART